MFILRFKFLVPLALSLSSLCTVAVAGIVPPRLVKPVEPVHPELLAAEGVATLSMKINDDGSISNIKVVSSTQSEFAYAAKEAAEQWEF